MFEPGNKILFKRGGNWQGGLAPQGSGTQGNRIVIGAYGNGALPRLDGSGVENTILLKNQEHWEISHLEITNEDRSGLAPQAPRRGVHLLNVNFGGEALTEHNTKTTTTLNDFYIHDLYIHDVKGEDKKDANGSSGIQVTVNIPDMVDGKIHNKDSINQRTTFDNIVIENNIIDDVHRSGILFWTDWKNRDLLRPEDPAFNENSVTPWTPITNVKIRGNKLYNIGGDGIAPHMTKGALVEYNYLDGYNLKSTGYNAGMWVWNADDTLFQYNEVTGGFSTRDGMPWDFDQGSQGVVYQYNYSYNNDGGTLLLCAESRGGVKDGTFRYNISYNDKYQTLTVCQGNNLEGINIYNNVFYIDETTNTAPLVNQGGNVQANIYNNIFVNNGHGGYATKPRWEYSNNIFAGSNIPKPNQIPGNNLTGVDPMFADVTFPGTVLNKDMKTRDVTDWSALDGFKIRATSPAVNGGRFVSLDINKHPGTAGTDFFHNSIHDGDYVYNGLPDIGAHEFSDVEFEKVTPFIPATEIEPSIPPFEVKLENGTFEDTTKHTNNDPWNFQWNGAITSNNPFEGKYAGEIKAVNGGASIEHIIAVAPNTEYRIDAMTMRGDANQKLTLGVKWNDKQGKEDKEFVEIKHTEYQPSSLTFTTPEGVNAVTLYYYKASGPAVASYIDTVSIEKVIKVDTKELVALIQEIDAIDSSLFTPESMGVLKTVSDKATKLLQSESLSQEMIDNLILEIRNAKSNLVKINPVDPVDPVDPIDPIDPVDPVMPFEPNEPATPITNETNKETVQTLPNTGMNDLIPISALVLSSVGIVIALAARRKNKS